jgi:hypothetical protein
MIKNSSMHDCNLSKQVYSELNKNSRLYHATSENQVTTCIGKSNIGLLGLIEDFVDHIQSNLDQGFVEVKSPHPSHSIKRCKPSTFARYFKLVNAYYACVREFDAYFVYSENVQIFKQAFEELGLVGFRFTVPGCYLSDRLLYEYELFNQLISCIRLKCQSSSFTSRVAHRRREQQRTFKTYRRYVESLFKRWSRLLVVRLDLSYLIERDEQSNRTHQLVSLEQVKEDLFRLLRNKRHNAMFDALVGYIWKLEYGDLKGYHYHLILFFKGSEVRSDYFKGKEIGDYWRDVITGGRGIYFNCSGKKSEYAHLGIGMINSDSEQDAALRFNLIHRVVRYLTKSAQYLKVKLKATDRSIGKGVVPKKLSNAGRPRLALKSAEAVV